MGTITFTITTTTPALTLSKSYMDTDANIQLLIAAMQAAHAAPTPAAGMLTWANKTIAGFVNLTKNYQQSIAPLTPINPT